MENSIAEVQAVQPTPKTVEFQGHILNVVDRLGVPWLRGHQIGGALGYARPDVAIDNIYKRNKDEFSEGMTTLVEAETAGGNQKVRIFSPRGCHLIAMFAKTQVAKEFRKWVLDVLDKETEGRLAPMFLTPEQQRLIQQAIGAKVHKLPKEQQRTAWASEYRRIKDTFHVATYSQVPMNRFDELMQFIDAEFVAPQPPAKPVKYHFPRETAKTPEMFSGIQQWMTYKAIADERFKNPLYLLMKQHHDNGDDIEGCWLAYQAMMHLLETYYNCLRDFEGMAHSVQQRGLNVLFR